MYSIQLSSTTNSQTALSQTTANALRLHMKDKEEEIANFAKNSDNYFDLLNVYDYTECYKKKKSASSNL